MNRPRGTRDFAPDEMAARTWAAGLLRQTFARFGYREVQTPTFEELELFTAKSGPGIVSELYDFTDKGGRQLTLRPELTAPVMRMYFQDHAFDPKPIKWFYHGPCFRYDRPQAGRYREFWQFGCEQIGAGTPLAYAELIALADAMFDAVGLQQRELSIGHVGVLRAMVDALGLAPDARAEAMRRIDKKAGPDALHELGGDAEALQRLLAVMAATSVDAARQAAGVAAQAAGVAAETAGVAAETAGVAEAAAYADAATGGDGGVGLSVALAELEACLQHLQDCGVQARLDLGIARGLDYYTGIVFECHSPVLGAQSQLLGGGGYDLSAVFGGQPTPTMGFGLGFDRTLVALEAEGQSLPRSSGPWLYAGAMGEEAQRWLTAQVAALRRDGVPVDMDLLGRRPGQIAKAADAAGARHLLIVGQRELEAHEVEVKDLRSGEAQKVALDMLLPWCLRQAEA